MGQDTLIYVKKADLSKISYFTIEGIGKYFSGRWYVFQDRFHLRDEEYPQFNYFTPEDIIKIIAGKKVREELVRLIKDLCEVDCIIQGDYEDFPKDKKEDNYINLTSILYKLWDDFVSKEIK